MQGCCHDESEHFQLKDNFSIPPLTDNIHLVVITIPAGMAVVAEPYNLLSENAQTDFQIAESPPPINSHKLRSIIQTYLI